MGSTGIAWGSSPCYFSLDDPEIVIEKNMVLAYHPMLHAQGEAGGVAIENTYRIMETGCEVMTQWPYEEIMLIGLPVLMQSFLKNLKFSICTNNRGREIDV